MARLRDFVLTEGANGGVKRAACITVATRSFARFLVASGRAAPGLDRAIPLVANWNLSALPRYIEPADLQRVIDACPTDTPIGVRDRAILLLLARLGLRAGDVLQRSSESSHFCSPEPAGSANGIVTDISGRIEALEGGGWGPTARAFVP